MIVYSLKLFPNPVLTSYWNLLLSVVCVSLELGRNKTRKKNFFASQSLYWYTDMGPGSAYKLHQVALKYSISKSHLVHQNTSETALNVKTLSVNSPTFHTAVIFKQPQDKLMFQKPLNKCISQASNKHCSLHFFICQVDMKDGWLISRSFYKCFLLMGKPQRREGSLVSEGNAEVDREASAASTRK